MAHNIVDQRVRWLEEQSQYATRFLEARITRDLRTNIKSTREDTCCVCLSKPSNVLFTNCGHLCICEECNNNLNDTAEDNIKCPMCRTEVTQKRIII